MGLSLISERGGYKITMAEGGDTGNDEELYFLSDLLPHPIQTVNYANK